MEAPNRPGTPYLRHRWIEPCAGLFVLALGVRAGLALLVGTNHSLCGDEPDYYIPALAMSNGLGYCTVPQQAIGDELASTAYRMPLPALILSSAFWLFGASIPLARWVSVAAGSCAAPLMFMLTRQVGSRLAAGLAGIACAVYPTFVDASRHIDSEPYFIPLMLLSLLLSSRAMALPSPGRSALAGVAWGLAALARPHAIPMAGALALYLLWKASWRGAAIFALLVVLTLLPWGIRNALTMGRFYLLATEGGETLLGANNRYVLENPELKGMWISPMSVAEYRERLKDVRNEFERDRIQQEMGLKFIIGHMEQMPRMVVNKVVRWLTPITGSAGPARIVVLCSYGGLLMLLVIGVAGRILRWSPALVQVVICSVILTAITSLYWGNLTRGRIPLELMWLPWAGCVGRDLLLRARWALQIPMEVGTSMAAYTARSPNLPLVSPSARGLTESDASAAGVVPAEQDAK
jgi:4-amino-4-deoxy-L-arabinose transferase-like glycosyltransferase